MVAEGGLTSNHIKVTDGITVEGGLTANRLSVHKQIQ